MRMSLSLSVILILISRRVFKAGVEYYNRYQHLFSSDQIPFVRASGSDRVVTSAAIWSDGWRFVAIAGYISLMACQVSHLRVKMYTTPRPLSSSPKQPV